MTEQPKKPPPSPWKRVPLHAKIAVVVVGVFCVAFAISVIHDARQPEPHQATSETTSDPCYGSIPSWLRPSSMLSVEQCRRMQAIQYQLQLEQELERNPNYKPYSITPNR